MNKSAVISECGKYRYHLQRVWDESLPRVCWIMLNPSTADAEQDDATIRRCIGFSKHWHHNIYFGGMDVVNLYALRTTYPSVLWTSGDPVGPLNDNYIKNICEDPNVGLVVAAWGANSYWRRTIPARHVRVEQVLKLLPHAIYQIGVCDFPRHPLRLSGSLQPVLYRVANVAHEANS